MTKVQQGKRFLYGLKQSREFKQAGSIKSRSAEVEHPLGVSQKLMPYTNSLHQNVCIGTSVSE